MHRLEHLDGLDPERRRVAGEIFALQRIIHDRSMELVGMATPPTELTMQQLRVLGFVIADPGLAGHELAEQLQVSAPTASGLVDRLVEKGLLKRLDDPEDRRIRRLQATTEAEELFRNLDSTLERSLVAVVKLLSLEDLELIRRGTQKIVDGMDLAARISGQDAKPGD